VRNALKGQMEVRANPETVMTLRRIASDGGGNNAKERLKAKGMTDVCGPMWLLKGQQSDWVPLR
jgi:hypothetical protein